MKVSALNIRRYLPLAGEPKYLDDLIPVEAPLEVFLYSHERGDYERFTVFMRTPTDDFELVAGFLLTEQIIESAADIAKLFYCQKVPDEMYGNTIRVILQPRINVESLLRQKRHFVSSSSCGICGSRLFKDLQVDTPVNVGDRLQLRKEVVFALPQTALEEQTTFKHTGGIHASSLFSLDGVLLSTMEDIGRHNALDKLIGSALLKKGGDLLEQTILLLSGRVSYELVLKAVVAKIPIICALGAPSTLAVELAKSYDVMLIAFIDGKKFNVYSGSKRVDLLSEVCENTKT